MPDELGYEEWEMAGRKIARAADMFAWCIGDWLVYGEERYADRYHYAVEAAGLNYQTLRNYAWVARRFEMSRRRAALSVQHHIEVARLPVEEQERWLGLAEEMKWSRNELRRRIRQHRHDTASASAETLNMPRIRVSPHQLELWHKTAEREQMEFETWVVATLDRYARRGLVIAVPGDDS